MPISNTDGNRLRAIEFEQRISQTLLNSQLVAACSRSTVSTNRVSITTSTPMAADEVTEGASLLDVNTSLMQTGCTYRLATRGNNTEANLLSLGMVLVTALQVEVGREYVISTAGNTAWTSMGAAANTAGTIFTATAAGAGSGTAILTKFIYSGLIAPVGTATFKQVTPILTNQVLTLQSNRVRMDLTNELLADAKADDYICTTISHALYRRAARAIAAVVRENTQATSVTASDPVAPADMFDAATIINNGCSAGDSVLGIITSAGLSGFLKTTGSITVGNAFRASLNGVEPPRIFGVPLVVIGNDDRNTDDIVYFVDKNEVRLYDRPVEILIDSESGRSNNVSSIYATYRLAACLTNPTNTSKLVTV